MVFVTARSAICRPYSASAVVSYVLPKASTRHAVTDDLLHHVRKLLAPDYDISHELGRGGMAVVYSGLHRRLGRRVAIKVLPPRMAFNAGARERFVREARLAAALNHPGIVPVYSATVRDDIAWFEMALVEGESLGKRLARDERLSIADARFVLAHVADALGYAHTAGVVHRDIKPDNILLDAATGRPMVTDFGIARTLDDGAYMTLEGVVLGTPTYMSPEQALGNAAIDCRADIYSLGVVGYQLLTGRVPFTASTTPALLAMHVSERPAPLLQFRPDTPLAIVAAIDGALEKKPAARWQSASAFRHALGEAPATFGGVTLYPDFIIRRPDTGAEMRTEGVARRITRFRRKFAASLALTCLLGVLNVVYFPGFLMFLIVAGLLALDLVIVGSALYAEDVPIKDLFVGEIRRDDPAVPSATYTGSPRYETVQRGAARDHAEIRRMLDALSDDERAMIPDIHVTVDALQGRIQSFVIELRQRGTHVSVETDMSGSVLSRLDSVADAMHAVRLELMNLRDARFERGLDAFNLTSENARSLSS